MNLLFKNLFWENENGECQGDVRCHNGTITQIGELTLARDEVIIECDGSFVYPAFINSHDHLEMNLYPKLGKPPYQNYVQWAYDINNINDPIIKSIEKVDIRDRMLWGGLKNLISGVHTVVHHNPWNSIFESSDFPVMVFKNYSWAHSLHFEKKIAHANPLSLFVIHAAEGVDAVASQEISELSVRGLLRQNSVIIHGINLSDNDIEKLSNEKCALVWCPASNLFMFNQTAQIEKLKRIKVALGTDSTMTGSPTFLHEMKIALQTNRTSMEEIVEMSTVVPESIFKVPSSKIEKASPANFFITRKKNHQYTQNLFDIQPSDLSHVVINGKIRLTNSQASPVQRIVYNPFEVNGETRYAGVNVKKLRQRISKKVSESILQANPLWNIIG
jgi:cytosine/adenosine deaminase-related metal-dependent hydrolase